MDETKIPAERLVSYLGAYMDGFGAGNFRAGASRFSNRHPDENLVSKFERIASEDIIDIEPIPLSYIAEFTEEWMLGFRPDSKIWTKHVYGVTRRVGRIWWGAAQTFWLDIYKTPCLYAEIKTLIYQDFEAAIGKKERLSSFAYLVRALRLLANYLNETYYCQITVKELEDNLVSFHIHHHPFASMDDEGFYLFWGLLDMFCEWLSPPMKIQPKGDAGLIEIDEENSTATQIMIVSPYKW